MECGAKGSQKMKDKILVTGSSGMIGTALCEKLLSLDIDFVGVDIRPNTWSGRIDRHTKQRDLRQWGAEYDDLISCNMIIHLAANARVFNLIKDPDLAQDNFLMTYNILEFARLNNIARFIFASSREVYGNSEKIVHKEDEARIENCESPYTATKIAGEALIHAYAQCYGLEFIILRFSNVYGKYDDSDRVIPEYIRRASIGKALKVFGKNKILDFTYIDDVVEGILKSIHNFKGAKNEAYNIATQEGYLIEDVAQRIKLLLNSNSEILLEKSRTGEVTRFVADISKAKAILHYEPQRSFSSGLAKTVEWWEEREKK